LRVFMSFARKEGAPLAQRLQKNLAKSGYDTRLDTQRTRSDAVWSTEIEREINTRRNVFPVAVGARVNGAIAGTIGENPYV
jgi:hypothetical protein